ncbi:MAG: hypothetical protein ACLR7Z_14365 [Bilophila wadsworthia]
MVVGFAKVVAGVGMGVEVEQGHGAVALRHGAQFRRGDGWSPPDHRDGPASSTPTAASMRSKDSSR